MRSVLTKSDIERMENQGKVVTESANDPLTQVGKSVPAEVLAFYLPLVGALSVATEVDAVVIANVSWILFVAGFLGTIGYSVFKFLKEGAVGIGVKTTVSTIAFVVWSLNMGGYTNYLEWFDQLYATVFLGLFSLATPLIFAIYSKVTKPPPKP